MNSSNSGKVITTPYVMYLQASSNVSSESVNSEMINNLSQASSDVSSNSIHSGIINNPSQVSSDALSNSVHETSSTFNPPVAPTSEPLGASTFELIAASTSEPPVASTSITPAAATFKPPANMPNSRGISQLSEERLMELIPEAMLPYWPLMSKEHKEEVKSMLENMEYLKEQCDALEKQKIKYKGDIATFKKMKTDLELKKQEQNEEMLIHQEQQQILKQLLQENENELIAYRKEVKKQLKLKKETDNIKTDISHMKREIKEINRKIIKQHSKINSKVPQEKEIYEKFSKGLTLLKDFRDIIENHGLMPQKKIDNLNENITEMQFDLALHEDDAEKIKQHNEDFKKMFPDKI